MPFRPRYTYACRGRITPVQKHAYETLFPKFGLTLSEESIDFEALFGRPAPVVMEIGFGLGEATAEIAAAHLETDYLTVEVFKPGIGSLLKRLDREGLQNIRIVHADAIEVLRSMIPPASLAAVHVFFPDPWPKKRHHKRRLIQPDFVAQLCDKLQPGGYLHLCTDWENYAEHMLQVLQAEPRLQNAFPGFAPRPEWRPMTKFERQGVANRHPVWDLHFIRRAGASR